MKKYMVADFVKDITEDAKIRRANRIEDLVLQYGISYLDAQAIVDSYTSYEDQENIAQIMDRYTATRFDAEEFYQTYHNPVEWDDVDEASEALEIDPMEITPDDIEEYLDIQDWGGSKGKPYVEKDTDLGKAFIYIAKGYFFIAIFRDGNPANYPISKQEAESIIYSDSIGTYYNEHMRNNSRYSDLPGSWGCIGPDPDNPKRLMTPEDKAKLPKDIQAYL